MEVVAVVLSGLSLVLLVVLTAYLFKRKNENTLFLDKKDKEEIVGEFGKNISLITNTLKTSVDGFGESVKNNLNNMSEKIKENREMTEGKFDSIEEKIEKKLGEINLTLEKRIATLQENNEKKLEQIQQTVDEKLTKTLNDRFNESFDILTKELEKVTKTVGEMQHISTDVGNLSKMLSNVKTTGIFGEIQLGAIIDEILSPEQYVKNATTSKNGREVVEFAIKLPGDGDGEVLLPIDSKFPYTIYSEMQTLYEENKFEEYESKKKQLVTKIKDMAKDICVKYINPPYTTDFAVMFLPVEGLYAEVVKCGLIDELRSKHKVTIAGPTTLAALLNSLQMGFQTLQIQQKSSEVWEILGKVKKEFESFGGIIEKVQAKITSANKELDELVGVRTRAINRSLRSVKIEDFKLIESSSVEDGEE